MAKNKNPKLREKLKQQHEAHRAHREERETKEQQDFTRAPTTRQAKHEARAATNLEYAPVVRGIRQEAAQIGKQAQQANQWYNQLGAEQAAAAQGSEAANAQFSSSLTQQLAAANAQNATYLAGQQQAAAQQAALTGQPLEASSGQAAAAGANQGALMGVALNAPVQAAGAAQTTLLRRQGIASRERGHEVQQGLLGEKKKVKQDLRAAQKQKGQAYVGRLDEKRQSAIKQELDAKAFELEGQQTALQAQQEQQKIAQDEVQSKRQAATTRAGNASTAASSAASTAASVEGNQISAQKAQREQQEFNAERRYKKNHGGRTPAEVNAAQKENREKQEPVKNEWKNAQAAAKTVLEAAKTNKKFNSLPPNQRWAFLEQAIENQGVEARFAHKAVEKLRRQSAPGEAAAEALPKVLP